MELSTIEKARLDELRSKYSNQRLETPELLELSKLQQQEIDDLGIVITGIREKGEK